MLSVPESFLELVVWRLNKWVRQCWLCEVRVEETANPWHDNEMESSAVLLKSDEELFYISSMDKYVFQDEFYDLLGRTTCLNRLCTKGRFHHLGDIVALPPLTVKKTTGLSKAQMEKLSVHIAKYGLRMGSNTDWWQRYRTTVPKGFRFPWSLSMEQHDLFMEVCSRLERLDPSFCGPSPALFQDR